ncbi:MAG: CopG family ribbon-helix-helix protein [Thermoplasmatota archaeon]
MVVISISVSGPDLAKFDEMVSHFGYDSRSSAVRDALYRFIADHRVAFGGEMDAVITLVYNADSRQDEVHGIVHEFQSEIQTSIHNHREHQCFDVLVVHGDGARIHEMVDRFTRIKDVRVNLTST